MFPAACGSIQSWEKALELHEDKTRSLSEHLQLLEKVELSMLGGSRRPP